ncbi:hypothetical protein BLNAU_11589 [Blattamonas nauphoetae]|uniref:Uncharacterized protein n=1 Tax=Blattamonas nauphoetae TaxID=2049346 RepID=A0ABQ9XSF2_9EUKA|nr:hypothetical protein BLNAU_11589 [Blattamonas nauphoetae]
MSIKPIQISTPTKDSDPNMPLPLSPGPYTPSQKNRLRRHNSQALGEKPVINCWYSAEQIEEARRDLIIPKDSLGLLGGEFMDYRKPLPSITGAGRRRFVNSPPKPAPKQEKSTVQETVQTQPMTFDQNVQTPHHVHSSQQQNFSPPQQTQPPPPLPSYPPYQPPYPQIPPPQLPNPYLQMPSYYPPQSYPQPPPYQVQMQIPPSYPTVQPIMTPMAFPQTVAVQQVPVTPFNPYQVQNPEPKQTPMDSYTQTPMGGNTIFPSPDIRKKQSQRPEFFDESTPEKKKEKKRRKRSRSSSRSTHRHKSHKHRKHHRSHRRRSKHRSRSPSISHGEKRNESSMGNTFVSQRSSIQSEIPSGLVKLDAETDLNMSLSTDHPVLNSPKSQHRTVQTSPHHQFNSTHRSINSQTQLPFSHTTSSSQRFSPNKRASSQSPLRSPPPSDPPPKSIRLIPAEWTETDDNKNSTYNTIEAFEDEIDKKEQSSVHPPPNGNHHPPNKEDRHLNGHFRPLLLLAKRAEEEEGTKLHDTHSINQSQRRSRHKTLFSPDRASPHTPPSLRHTSPLTHHIFSTHLIGTRLRNDSTTTEPGREADMAILMRQ